MLRCLIIPLSTAASAALAFTPTHLVVVEGAVVYDEEHNYDDDHVIARLTYWTPVEVAPIGWPTKPKPYCRVTLIDGSAGLTDCENLAPGYEVVAEEAVLRLWAGSDEAELTRVYKGDRLADAMAGFFVRGKLDWFEVKTETGIEGWIAGAAVNRWKVRGLAKFNYGGPREGPPQHAGE
jgi:hypothetical protein